jgi:hypothetical protein
MGMAADGKRERSARRKRRRAGAGGEVAKGAKTSLAVRAAALLFALALVGLAAKLWLDPAQEEPLAEAGDAVVEEEEGAAEVSAEPPPPDYEEIPAEDREALRELLRDDQAPSP